MNLRNHTYFSLFIFIFVLITTCSAYFTFKTNENIQLIKKKILVVNHFNERSTFNPHTDIKLMILRKYPNLMSLATTSSQNSDEYYDNFKLKIYNKYILEDHSGIQNLLSSKQFDRDAISILTFLYILPAYLYEREGFSDLALTDYNRYYSCYKKITGNCDFENGKNVQDRISIVRLKKYFLKHSIPSLRKVYYDNSYFTYRTMNFFDGISQNIFLKNYVKCGYLCSAELGENCGINNYYSFYSTLTNFLPYEIPFETYEALANIKYLNIEENNTTDQKILSNVDTVIKYINDPFIKSLCLFKKGVLFFKSGKNQESNKLFLETIKTEGIENYFLHDDASYFIALIQCMGNYDAIDSSITKIKSDFNSNVKYSN